MALTELRPNPRNPNHHPDEQIKLLAKIIEKQGWRQPVKVSTRSGMIVSGHGRYQAAKLLQCPVPVDFQDYASEEEELADLTADNRIAELAENDEEMLAEILAEINLSEFPIEMTGYTDEDLEAILDTIVGEDVELDPEYQDEEYQQLLPPMSKPGDLWMLGPHRLICGDSTDKETVDRLMNGTKADMVMTDPPYGINAEKMTMGTGNRDYHRGEGWDSSRPDISIAFDLAPLICIWGGNYFTDKLPVTNDWLIWHKKNDGLSFSECELAWTNFGINCRHISHHWGSEKKQHVTMKPLAVIIWAIEMAKQSASVVVDLFGGSGTTLIACEHLGRTCYTMEIDPVYCDVIISRYVTQTGNIGVTCVRDGKEMSYMDLVREWSEATGEEDRINSMNIPVVVTKKIVEGAVTAQDAL